MRFEPVALREFLATPGLVSSTLRTLAVGLISTGIAVLIALLLPSSTRIAGYAGRLAPTLLAIPHLSMAVALAFLLSPSGWLMRIASPWLTGLERPPVGIGGEFEAGALLVFGLTVKEVPFLLLVATSQLRQIDQARLTVMGRSLGYGHGEAWIKLVLPLLYLRMRPAVIAVMMFSLANVEMALPMGPTNPPTLAVMALDMLNDPELWRARIGGMVALILILLCLLAIALWLLAERSTARLARHWLVKGSGSRTSKWLRLGAVTGACGILLASAGSVAALVVWSMAGPWRFPKALPASLQFDRFSGRLLDLFGPALTTVWLAGITVAMALAIAIMWLEYRTKTKLPNWLYLPLLVPQIAILAGLNFMLLSLGFGINVAGIVAGHLLFVVPYVVLVLGDGFYALDGRYARTARSLGHNRLAALICIKLPLLRPSLFAAAAIGFSVSVALYLPTIFAGGGRVATLATEIIAISHGGDRRMMAACGLLLAVLPLLALTMAQTLGRPAWEDRR